MLKIGCAEKILEVPLFAELFGYGPFAGRRNRGVLDPIYCRVAVFNDGSRRAAIVYSDLCICSDEPARKIRRELSERFGVAPEGIAFTMTHTHSAPLVESTETTVGFGYPCPEFQRIWHDTVLECFANALADGEEITRAECGKTRITCRIAANRVAGDAGPIDPEIRWVRFFRGDGSPKLLIHNHGIHGVSVGAPYQHLVSGDWPGAANRRIQERKLADFAIFLQGASGDINCSCPPEECNHGPANEAIAEKYISDLARGLEDGSAIDVSRLGVDLETYVLPVIDQTPAELRQDAAKLLEVTSGMSPDHRGWAANIAARLEESAMLREQGQSLHSDHDFQTLAIGDVVIRFVPGELFIEPGMKLLAALPSGFPMISTCSNGNGGYFFSRECAEKYPDISLYSDRQLFGYYEIYGYMHGHGLKYPDDIADFILGTVQHTNPQSQEKGK